MKVDEKLVVMKLIFDEVYILARYSNVHLGVDMAEQGWIPHAIQILSINPSRTCDIIFGKPGEIQVWYRIGNSKFPNVVAAFDLSDPSCAKDILKWILERDNELLSNTCRYNIGIINEFSGITGKKFEMEEKS